MGSYAMPPTSSQPSPNPSGKRSQDLSDQEAGRWSGEDSDGNVSRDSGTSKRRKRDDYSHRPVSVSCETCKLRKVKCDRGQPSCSWCLKNRQICEYKERKKPGLRAGYGRELEAKLAEQGKLLERIQDVLLRHESTLSQLLTKSANVSPTPHSPASSVAYVQSDSYRQRAPKDTAQLPSLSSYVPGVAQNATSADLSRYGRSSYPQQLSSEESSRRMIEGFPDPDICHAVCEAYFQHTNKWLPILLKDLTMKTLLRSPPHLLDQAEQILLHALIASSLRFCLDTRLTDDTRRRQEQYSTERVELYCLHHTSIMGLQALFILTVGVVGDQGLAATSNLMSLLIKSAVQMGLTKEIEAHRMEHNSSMAPKPRDFMEEESQRRLMWAIFIVDRLVAHGSSSRPSLSDHMERRLPCHDEFFISNRYIETPWLAAEEQNQYPGGHGLGPFSYFVELISILSRIDNFVQAPPGSTTSQDGFANWRAKYEELDKQLLTWHAQTPSYYKAAITDAQTKPEWYDINLPLTQALGYAATIGLHFDVAFSDSNANIAHLVSPSSAAGRCHSAAENILQILDFVRSRQSLSRMGPFFAMSLAMAKQVFMAETDPPSRDGSTLFPLALYSNHKDKSRFRSTKLVPDPRLFILGTGLMAMAEDWPMAAGYVDRDDLGPSISPRIGNAIDPLKDPRLPTGFDRILDTGPQRQEHVHHLGPGHVLGPRSYSSSPQQDARAQWAPHQ